MSVQARRRLVGLVAVVVLAGCSSLPTSGEVHTRADESAGTNQAPYFAPPGPAAGADPESIVNGFLLAVQANPPSTAVARSFLTTRAKDTWKPVQGTTVYDSSSLQTGADGVTALLTGAHTLDERGGWVGGSSVSSMTVPFTVVRQNDAWRISNPPSSLPVPLSYFRNLYVPFTLYFFDRSGTVLVPRRIYLPRGEQIATNLVRGLLAGPDAEMAAWTETAIPPGTGLDLAVTTNANGLAEVPLGPEVQRLSPPDLHRLVIQLAWTLRQVPGITRLRVTSNGVAVPLPNGDTDVSLSSTLEYDPIEAASGSVVAIANGRAVNVDAVGSITPVGGPLGQPGHTLRSVAQSMVRRQVAAVTGSGTRLYVAADRGPSGEALIRTAVSGASNLLRPVYDRFGGLWVVDAARSGAVVHHLDGTDRIVEVPGVSGHRVSSFTVTRDGARLVFGVASSAPALLVSDLVRGTQGRLVRVLKATRIAVEGNDLGAVADLGQNGATTVSVLTRTASGTARIVSVELDGSPGDAAGTPDPVPDPLVSLLVSPDPNLPVRALDADRRLLELGGSGEWTRLASGILAGSYVQ